MVETLDLEKMENNLICPECTSNRLKKAGSISTWRDRKAIRVQRYRCQDCGLLTIRPDVVPLDYDVNKLPDSEIHDVNILDPEKNRLICLRCGHEWESLNPHPRQCPKCHSGYWDRPKKESVNAPVVIYDVNKEGI